MFAVSAIVLSIDRLGAGWLGPYGNTWLETPGFNRLAAQSLLFETVLADSASIEQCGHAWWLGRHALQADAEPTVRPLAGLASNAGARTVLVGVRPEIAQSIVGLGINLVGIGTSPTLAAAIRSLQRREKAPRG